ncbi:maleylpyruvate isomerase family mycothiol-dependent enzyme [Arthrobacter sp. I2-34]|uniref:Maleylpyruvate isomerase family mycothiol-dependent enzyme n=1 Tax=Arthrobacter hankyongi TaxID=2904801 RepID=A0ABS9LCS4_9MICC|nr:maleylpyruvate isomerase family mycothiol-dependent enzyme [Arthrobacter hankyongi]MCG2624473.1 maleylpyruvate isomerase family mycothiol-dependent enzyme [Arthrobacter hankyongi]
MAARQDLAGDPALLQDLLTVRRGTAFFGRKLNELTDDQLKEPSLLPGWTRAHVVAHVGYNARAIARLMAWANTGVETPMYASPEARNGEIDYGATLPPAALRHLYEHSAIHLNVEWRDTPDAAWSHLVKTAQGRTVPASETVWMRIREVWIHAVDLDNGATFADIPATVLERLLTDITEAWQKRGTDKNLVLKVAGAPSITKLGDTAAADPEIITGTLSEITAWAAGRPARGITSSRYEHPESAPRWL